jgi:hypothetical protein
MPATKHFALRLPADLYETLRAESFASGKSINTLVTELVDTHVRDNRRQLIDLIGRAANERYAIVLDKLADL